MKFKLLLASALVAASMCLTACASAQSTPTPEAAAQSVSSITGADLDAAVGIATANGDTIGAACYTALKKHLGEAPAQPAVAGVFSAFEVARTKVNTFAAGVPQDVHIACAPVVLDAQATLLRLGVISAGAKLLPLP
jgi:hypothetical protein